MKQPLLALDWGAPKALRSRNHALKLLNPYPSFPPSSPSFETQIFQDTLKGFRGMRFCFDGLMRDSSFKGLGFGTSGLAFRV